MNKVLVILTVLEVVILVAVLVIYLISIGRGVGSISKFSARWPSESGR